MVRPKVRPLPPWIKIVPDPTKPPPDPQPLVNGTSRPVTLVPLDKCDIRVNVRRSWRRRCDVCGIGFMVQRTDACYCSPKCRKAMSRFHSRYNNIGALTLFCELYPHSKIADEVRKGVRRGS